MSWIAVGVGAAGLVGGVLQSNAARSAASQQAAALEHAAELQFQEFQTINAQQAPWRQAGQNALQDIAGMKDFFTHQFSAQDLNANLAPNYEFTKQQGLGALQNFATTTGGLLSGNTLKGIADYTSNYAMNSYQNAFNNFTANQSNIFNRLASIAGLGQQANTTTAQAGTSLAQSQGQLIAAGGAAQAGGTVGSANAIAGGLQNAMSWYALPSILRMNTQTAANPGNDSLTT